jgi:myo-inositol-hexaphosphate 3-phosphohydrolase
MRKEDMNSKRSSAQPRTPYRDRHPRQTAWHVGVAVLLALCVFGSGRVEARYPEVAPTALELDGPGENVDDPCFWVDPADPAGSLIFITTKDSHLVEVFNVVTGAFVATIPGFGIANNCAVHGDLLLTTDRGADDNVKVHHIPDFALLRTFGEGMGEPEGIDVLHTPEGETLIYVTDSSDASVHVYDLATGALVRSFSTGFGAGIEPILADDLYQRIYVARGEKESTRGVGLFDPDGTLLFEFAANVFKNDAEGMAIYACGAAGYLVIADQHGSRTELEIFDRVTLQHLGTFNMQDGGGEFTSATDGIDILQTPLPGFPNGLLAACDGCGSNLPDEMDVVSWDHIAAVMGLHVCPDGGEPECATAPCTERVLASADTFITAVVPDTNFGTAATLEIEVDPPNESETLLRVDVPDLTGFELLGSTLRLNVPDVSSASTDDGGTLFITTGDWSETGVTYNTRPAPIGEPIDSVGTVDREDAVDFDVSQTVTGAGTYDFLLLSTSEDKGRYLSREGNESPPALLLRLQESSPPEVAITAPADGTAITPGDTLTLSATATDAEDGDLSFALVWRSDRDGALGTGTPLSTSTLSQGAHLITAEVVDGAGLSGTATVSVLVNTPPTVTITAPGNGAQFSAGVPITLMATAGDAEEGDLTSAIAWTSNLDGGLGTGGSLSVATLRLGLHTITASVTDNAGKSSTDQITVMINDSPIVVITSPPDGAHVLVGIPLLLTATALDPEDGDLSAAIDWTSDRDGQLGTGPLVIAVLSEGTHLVSAQAADSAGAVGVGRISLVVSVTLGAPAVTITAPSDGTVVAGGAPVTFAATAIDLEDGDVSATLAWISDRAGPLGTGSTITVSDLSGGLHVIRAEATDSDGLLGAAGITLVVDSPPIVTILSPADGTALVEGVPVILDAAATDPEEGDLSAAVTWTSSLDGSLGAGSSLVVPHLSVGAHEITAAAADSGARVGTATVTIIVNASFMSFNAVADAFVVETAPTSRFGADTHLLIKSGGPALRAFMRFQVSGTDGLPIQRATLRLTVDTTASAGSTSGGEIYAISDTGWHEFMLTYNTQPPIDGPLLDTAGPISPGEVVEFDVTSVLSGDGSYVFALFATVDDTAVYRSREAVGREPQLVLSLLPPNLPPDVAITSPADGAVVAPNTPVTLVASASDAEDGDLSAGVVWRSDLAGPLGTGSPLTLAGLPAGIHTIRCDATDIAGRTGSAEITLVVDGTPVVAILEPADGSILPAGSLVTLTATAIDQEDGDLSAALEWSSDRDGFLGGGASLTVLLSEGVHAITATVSDAVGNVGTATVQVDMVDGPPVVTILAPSDGAVVLPGEPVTLSGQALDDVDGDLSGSLEWASSLDGSLGTGASLVVSTLSVGSHTITATVTDGGGVQGSASVGLVVNAEIRFVSAVADTYVDGQAPTVNFGLDETLAADVSPERQGFFRFVVSGAGAVPPRHAVLRLTVGTVSGSPSDLAGTVHAITDTAWNETTLTYANRPAIDGPPLATIDRPVDTGEVVDFDVTSAITGDGTYVFALITTSSNAVRYVSREAAAGAPQLLLFNYGVPGDPPALAITEPADGTSVAFATPLTLSAVAADPLDGDLSAAVDWTSDLDGALGGGATISVSTLSFGSHLITATVTNSSGGTTTASVGVTVSGVTLTVPAAADVAVMADQPDMNFGTSPDLTIDASPVRRAYLRFGVAGVGTRTITRATLRLTVSAQSKSGGPSGGELHPITDASWDEATVTFTTSPPVDGPVIAAVGSIVEGQVVDFDVTGTVLGDGTWAFALENPSGNKVVYVARESGTGGPELILEVD